jgi:hypothetical protein
MVYSNLAYNEPPNLEHFRITMLLILRMSYCLLAVFRLNFHDSHFKCYPELYLDSPMTSYTLEIILKDR